MISLSDFKAGERIEYFMHEIWYPATIEKIGKNRLVIRIDKFPKRTRNTVPNQVRKIMK